MAVRDDIGLGETAMAVPSDSDARTRIDHGPHAHFPDEGLDLSTGQLFRGLRIRSMLGAGAMGNAYLASHEALRAPVVIKLFRVSGADPLAEAHLAARVKSSAVVPVLDAGVEGGVPYIIQRYVDGIDLEELLGIHSAAERTIPVPTLVRIAVDIFTGLAAIHTAGVVHRDIKPPNLFLAGSGEAQVGDFGIAVDPNAERRPEVAGTPMFIAPELWNGLPASPRSDLYSAAATLHLLWQRTAPFTAPSVTELARMHCEEPYKPPPSSDPVGAYFGAVLARLLSKDPAARPESALATARLLARVATPPPELRGQHEGTARIGDVSITLEQRDIATADTDVIVAPCKPDLMMRKGSAYALKLAAGDELEAAAARLAPVTMGQVIWTEGYRLRCKEVAHAAAALEGAICVQRAMLRTLFEAERRGHGSITFPALGTGTAGVPHGLGARLILEAIRTFASFAPKSCLSIRIALANGETLASWCRALVALDASRS